MDFLIVSIFIVFFIVIGGGGVLFWKHSSEQKMSIKGIKDFFAAATAPASAATGIPVPVRPIDAVVSPWSAQGSCKAHSGQCGKGIMKMKRGCSSEGLNGGKTCADVLTGLDLEKDADCYVDCPRPGNVVDWGHPNDMAGLPRDPKKGWYDFTGQGQPNDYCRWVGDENNRFWACHTSKDPYTKADPSHITFSSGPSNKLTSVTKDKVVATCPTDHRYIVADDPDLQKSIVNGLMAPCSAGCVYDHRNPKTGWAFSGDKWVRVEDFSNHFCGIRYADELKKAVDKYNQIYDVKNSWTV